jgi:hypothetical protein
MNVMAPSIQKPPAKPEALGSQRLSNETRSRLPVAVALAILAVILALSAYAAIHSSGVVIDLP